MRDYWLTQEHATPQAARWLPTILAVLVLSVCGALAACSPREIPPPCTPLPIVDGYETAMTEGDTMKLRVPAHSAFLTNDCKKIKSVELIYYWYKGKLVWGGGPEQSPDISRRTLGHPIKIYVTEFKPSSDIAFTTLKPWQFEDAVRHYKYPLEFYPKFYWTAPDQPPAKAPPDVRWGVVGTRSPFGGNPFNTACNIDLGTNTKTQADVVKGEFLADYSDAKCRGGIASIKGDKMVTGMIDVWANNAHDIDKIYHEAIATMQTYIQE